MIIKLFENFITKDEYYKQISQHNHDTIYKFSSNDDNLELTKSEISKIMKLFPEEKLHKYNQSDKRGRMLYQLKRDKYPFEYEYKITIIVPYKDGDRLCLLKISKKKDDWFYVTFYRGGFSTLPEGYIGKPDWKDTWYECDNMDGLIILLKDIKRGKEQESKTN